MWTALEVAAEYGRVSMIQLLVDHGAQLHGIGATQFERAKSLAAENNLSAVIELLDVLLAKQLASLDHNFQDQWMFSMENGVISDGSEVQEGSFDIVPTQDSIWPTIDNLDFHSNVDADGGIEFLNGVTSPFLL
jgi:hypothetical protein